MLGPLIHMISQLHNMETKWVYSSVCVNILSLQNVISIGAGEELVSEYRSVIFYHVGKPEWVETIKVNHYKKCSQ